MVVWRRLSTVHAPVGNCQILSPASIERTPIYVESAACTLRFPLPSKNVRFGTIYSILDGPLSCAPIWKSSPWIWADSSPPAKCIISAQFSLPQSQSLPFLIFLQAGTVKPKWQGSWKWSVIPTRISSKFHTGVMCHFVSFSHSIHSHLCGPWPLFPPSKHTLATEWMFLIFHRWISFLISRHWRWICSSPGIQRVPLEIGWQV